MTGLEIAVYGLIAFIALFYIVSPVVGLLMDKIVNTCNKEEGTYERYVSLGFLLIVSLLCIALICFNAYAVAMSFITL